MTDVYIPTDRQGWWGGKDERPRCRRCGKVVFGVQSAAEASAERIRARDPRAQTMNAYRCKSGNWHVGRSHALEPRENFGKVKL